MWIQFLKVKKKNLFNGERYVRFPTGPMPVLCQSNSNGLWNVEVFKCSILVLEAQAFKTDTLQQKSTLFFPFKEKKKSTLSVHLSFVPFFNSSKWLFVEIIKPNLRLTSKSRQLLKATQELNYPTQTPPRTDVGLLSEDCRAPATKCVLTPNTPEIKLFLCMVVCVFSWSWMREVDKWLTRVSF